MINLVLKIIKLAVTLVVIIIEIALIIYISRVKSTKPNKNLKKIANIEKYKIGKNTLYKILQKENLKNDFNILYFHGGAYSGALTKEHWDFIERIYKDTGANILVPDYPLIPKHTYKDVFDMTDKIYENHIKDNNFVILGDSAGGGIGLAFSQKLGIENKKLPTKTILISPWLDITMKNKEIDEVQRYDKCLNKVALKVAGDLYSSKNNPDNYLVSPINGPMDKIKNIFIFTGTYDILNPDVSVLKEKVGDKKIFIYEKDMAYHNWILKTYENEEDYKKLLNTLME